MMTSDSDFDHLSNLIRDYNNRSLFVTIDDDALQSNHCTQCMLIGNHVVDLMFIISDNATRVLRHVITRSYQVKFMVIAFVSVLNDML